MTSFECTCVLQTRKVNTLDISGLFIPFPLLITGAAVHPREFKPTTALTVSLALRLFSEF